jgi:hypothetical protein
VVGEKGMKPNPAHQAILDRILKILALAEGSSFEGEAANARRIADELLAKYNLTLPEDEKKRRDELAFEAYVPWSRKSLWERLVAQAITKLCGCNFLYHGDVDEDDGYNRFVFVGTVANIESCLYILGQVHLERQRAWMRYKAEGGKDSFGKFCFSFARGIETKVDSIATHLQAKEADRALEWYKLTHSVVHGKQIRGSGSSDAGHAAGHRASFHRGAMGTPVKRIGR